MTYPDTPGAQRHSETSREAAAKLDAGNMRDRVLRYLIDTPQGLTCDDISLCMTVEQGTIAARLRELELKGLVIKTANKGSTRYNRKAYVYVAKENWRDDMGRAAVKAEKPTDIIKLEAEHGRMKEALESCYEYFDQRADADGGQPNEEMSLLIQVEAALGKRPA